MNRVLMISDHRTREMGGGPEKEENKRILQELGWEVEIGYVSNPTISGILNQVPKFIYWLRTNNVDIMVTHCSPPELHILGFILKKTTGIPWLAEYRDPLVTNPDVAPGSFSHFQRRILEKFVVNSADYIAWWENIQMDDGYFSDTYPKLDQSKFHKIPYLGVGGVNFDKFDDLDLEPYEEFTITYAGSFYDGWIEPYGFLEGLRKYVDRHGSTGINVQFYGDWKKEYQQKVCQEGLDDVVTTHDPVPHEKIIEELKKSHLLLYIGGNDPRNRNNISLKMADYVAAELPILGVINPSFRAGAFIEKENIGIAVHPKDANSIADAIHNVRMNKFEYELDDCVKNRFNSREEMREYTKILDEVTNKG